MLSEFSGDNRTNVAGTVLASDIGGTWYNAGAGFNAAITENVALYGSGEYNFGDVEGWAGTAGLEGSLVRKRQGALCAPCRNPFE